MPRSSRSFPAAASASTSATSGATASCRSGLVRQQLKVRYKGSVLGFVWSLLNPLLYLVVFYFVFQVFLGSGIPSFPIFLLSGLLVWNLFVGSILRRTGSIIDNGIAREEGVVPARDPPAGVHRRRAGALLPAVVVLFAAIAIVRYPVPWSYLWLVVPAPASRCSC